MFKITGLSKSFCGRVLFKNVTLSMSSGERVGLSGPPGSGKTTLLRIIAGQERPDTGSVQLHPPSLRLGYLEQGQQYAEGDSLADFLQVGERALEAASERVARLATALAAAEGADLDRLMEAYSQALAELDLAAGSGADAFTVAMAKVETLRQLGRLDEAENLLAQSRALREFCSSRETE